MIKEGSEKTHNGWDAGMPRVPAGLASRLEYFAAHLVKTEGPSTI